MNHMKGWFIGWAAGAVVALALVGALLVAGISVGFFGGVLIGFGFSQAGALIGVARIR